MSSKAPVALEARPEAQGGIPRDRLASRLAAALDSGCVVLTAGAGFGKTTALDAAVRRNGMRVAWVSCSEAERTSGTLLMRIVAAVAQAAPGASDALAERLA